MTPVRGATFIDRCPELTLRDLELVPEDPGDERGVTDPAAAVGGPRPEDASVGQLQPVAVVVPASPPSSLVGRLPALDLAEAPDVIPGRLPHLRKRLPDPKTPAPIRP